jgi:hypothetical protein
MTSCFVCDRCGSVYGILVKAHPEDEQHQRLADCVAERCLPIRKILNRHAEWLRLDTLGNGVPHAAEVAEAIELSEKRWAKKWGR